MSASSPAIAPTPAPESPIPLIRRAPSARSARPQSIYDLSLDALAARLVEWDEPSYRATQIYGWLYRRLATSYDEMTDLPAALRARLQEELPLVAIIPAETLRTDDNQTVKTLYRTRDGEFMEAVLMFYPDRVTVCVSCRSGARSGAFSARQGWAACSAISRRARSSLRWSTPRARPGNGAGN